MVLFSLVGFKGNRFHLLDVYIYIYIGNTVLPSRAKKQLAAKRLDTRAVRTDVLEDCPCPMCLGSAWLRFSRRPFSGFARVHTCCPAIAEFVPLRQRFRESAKHRLNAEQKADQKQTGRAVGACCPNPPTSPKPPSSEQEAIRALVHQRRAPSPDSIEVAAGRLGARKFLLDDSGDSSPHVVLVC